VGQDIFAELIAGNLRQLIRNSILPFTSYQFGVLLLGLLLCGQPRQSVVIALHEERLTRLEAGGRAVVESHIVEGLFQKMQMKVVRRKN
jgi:hypothetical protein